MELFSLPVVWPEAKPPPEALDTYRQVWLSLLWGHCSFSWLLVHTRFCLCPPRVCFPSPVEVPWSNPTGLQSQIRWCFSVPLLDPQVRKSVVDPRTFLTVWEFLWYNCSAVCGLSARQLYGGTNGNLLQECLCYTLCDPVLLQPEPLAPWQATADLCLHRSHSNTQRQVWLSLCGASGSWCTQGFVWALPVSLACMEIDSKHYFVPPTIFLGLLLCLWMWGIFLLVVSNIFLWSLFSNGL